MFKRIAIDNYRCFSNFEFRPNRINLLLGKNGCGKSSFIDLIGSVLDVVCNGVEIREATPNATRTRWETRLEQRFDLDVVGAAGLYRYSLTVAHEPTRDRVSIKSEVVSCGDRTLFAYSDGEVHLHNNDGRLGTSFPFRGGRSFLAEMDERPETSDLTEFLNLLKRVQIRRLDSKKIKAASKAEEKSLARDGSNFVSWYRHLQQQVPDRIQELSQELVGAIPGFRTLRSLSDDDDIGGTRRMVATLSTSGTSYDVSFDELSDGQRSLIVLYTLLAGLDPSAGSSHHLLRGGFFCLLLDEPETHVGLSEIQPWLTELDERLQDRGQVFVASHHPEVVDYLSASDPYLFERPDGGPARAHPAVFDRATGLTAATQLARGLVDAGAPAQ